MRVIRAKVIATMRFLRIFHILRENAKEIGQIKKMMPEGKLPLYTLIGGYSGVHQSYLSFY
jgi:hypothetical protein